MERLGGWLGYDLPGMFSLRVQRSGTKDPVVKIVTYAAFDHLRLLSTDAWDTGLKGHIQASPSRLR